jgi:predicted membrane protein
MTGAALGFLVGAILTNLNLAILHFDESRTLGAACENAEATLVGGSAGLLTGLAAAASFSLLRRRQRSSVLSVLGAVTGALTALLLFTFLLHPFATNHLPVLICSS